MVTAVAAFELVRVPSFPLSRTHGGDWGREACNHSAPSLLGPPSTSSPTQTPPDSWEVGERETESRENRQMSGEDEVTSGSQETPGSDWYRVTPRHTGSDQVVSGRYTSPEEKGVTGEVCRKPGGRGCPRRPGVSDPEPIGNPDKEGASSGGGIV